MKTFKGKTEDAGSPILGAPWWKSGSKISGKVLRDFQTENGTCYEIELLNGVDVGEEKNVHRVSVGALKGFQMALAAAGVSKLLPEDNLYLECTGAKETDKGNPMVNFYVEVERA